jgi:hypothetical protein
MLNIVYNDVNVDIAGNMIYTNNTQTDICNIDFYSSSSFVSIKAEVSPNTHIG